MQTLKRKWQNFKTYRKLDELWSAYKERTPSESNPKSIQSLLSLSEFLDALKEALSYHESHSEGKSQIEQVFGNCGELLSAIVASLNYFLKNTKQASESQNSALINKILEVLIFSIRTEKFKKTVESSSEGC